jgi:hypothetical protein
MAAQALTAGVLSAALAAPLVLVSSWRRGYLPGFVALVAVVMATQLITALGGGAWFPFVAPSLWMAWGPRCGPRGDGPAATDPTCGGRPRGPGHHELVATRRGVLTSDAALGVPSASGWSHHRAAASSAFVTHLPLRAPGDPVRVPFAPSEAHSCGADS